MPSRWANDPQEYNGGWYNQNAGGGGMGMGMGQSSGGYQGGQPNFNVRVPRRTGYGNFGQQPGFTAWDPTGASQASASASANAETVNRANQMWENDLSQENMALMHKYDMQKLQAQLASQQQNQWMQMYANGMNMPTADQIERSRGDLQGSKDDYQGYIDNGRYNADQMNTLSQNSWNQINDSALNSAKTMNSQMSAMGLGSNPGAAAALGMSGRFAANAERGNVLAGLERENADARQFGVQGKAGINSQMADYASRPINRMADMDFSQMPWMQGMGGGGGGMPFGNGKRPKPQPGGGTQFSFSQGAPQQQSGPLNIAYEDFQRKRQQGLGGGY